MAPYNLTAIGVNSTGFLEFTQAVDTVLLGGWLGLIFLIGITLLIYLATMFATNDSNKSLLSTSFITIILSLILTSLNLLTGRALIIILLICGGTAAVIWPRN